MTGRLAPLAIAVLAWGSTALAAEVPAHHADRGFRNPYSDAVSGGAGNFLRVVRMRFFSDMWPTYDPHQDIGAAASLAIHWGAFFLSAEGLLTPMHALAAARAEAGIPESEFAAFAVGETRRYPARR